jgi:cytoskeleton protein RodZ
MGDVGARLRDTRERLGIDIDQIEAETHIRVKYLVAVEEERFDALPGPAYVRAFVRDYAEQVGLDPRELVAELDTRPDLVEEVVMAPPRQIDDVPLLDRRTRIAAWVAALALAALVAVVAAVVYLGSGGGSSSAGAGPAGATHPGHAAPPATSTVESTTAGTGAPAPPQARPRALVMVATQGDVWLLVRAGSATGKVLYQNTLASGRRLTFLRRRLWVRVGAPWNLAVTVGRRRLTVPLQAPGDILVTATGARLTI